MGIPRVHDQRDTHRLEGSARELGSLRRGGGGKLCAADVREVDARLLEHRAVAQHAGFSTAALGAAPRVTAETSRAIRGFDRRGQLIVQTAQVLRDFVDR